MDKETVEWLSNIEEAFEDSRMLDLPSDIEEDKLQDTSVFYLVIKNNKNQPERVATIYESANETYDASTVADIMLSVFEVVPELVNYIRDVSEKETVNHDRKIGAVRFIVDRAMEVLQEENASIDTVRQLVQSMSLILYSDEIIDMPEVKKEDDKISLLHLLPDAARGIFGD